MKEREGRLSALSELWLRFTSPKRTGLVTLRESRVNAARRLDDCELPVSRDEGLTTLGRRFRSPGHYQHRLVKRKGRRRYSSDLRPIWLPNSPEFHNPADKVGASMHNAVFGLLRGS